VRAVAFSPNGKQAMTGSIDGTARLWDATSGRPLGQPVHHRAEVVAVAFRLDGRAFLTGSLWDVSTRGSLGPPLRHRAPLTAVAFSPEGALVLTAEEGGQVRLWDAHTGKRVGPALVYADSGDSEAVAFTGDGRTLFATRGTVLCSGPVPVPIKGEPQLLSLWAQVLTGMKLGADNDVEVLDAESWQRSRRDLRARGGPPIP
jgi:WD40 repeat protein